MQTRIPSTAEQMYNRMSSIERGMIVGAQNDDRLDWIRRNSFIGDGPPEMEEMQRLYEMVIDEYSTKGASAGGF